MTIKSVYFSQDEILDAIEKLHCPEGFVCDMTFGNGSFYQFRSKPIFRFDCDSSLKDVSHHSSESLPLPDNCVQNAVFDPPFLTYIKKGRESGSIMGKRFSGYWCYNELTEHYKNSIKEAARIYHSYFLVFKKDKRSKGLEKC